jgi:hypothetical protein
MHWCYLKYVKWFVIVAIISFIYGATVAYDPFLGVIIIIAGGLSSMGMAIGYLLKKYNIH